MSEAIIEVRDLTIGYERRIIMQDLNFSVLRGEVFCIMGGSGCGKSTLMKHLIGLYAPMTGDIRLFGQSIVETTEDARQKLMRRFGVTYQGGALFGSMTVAENIMLPLAEYTSLSESEQREVAEAKLKQVDLAGYGDYMPSELSGGTASSFFTKSKSVSSLRISLATRMDSTGFASYSAFAVSCGMSRPTARRKTWRF